MYFWFGTLYLSPCLPKYPFLRIHANNLFSPISYPFCAINFASSPIRHEFSAPLNAFVKVTAGLVSSIIFLFCSLRIWFSQAILCFSSRSFFNCVARLITRSGLFIICSKVGCVAVIPYLRSSSTLISTHTAKSEFSFCATRIATRRCAQVPGLSPPLLTISKSAKLKFFSLESDVQ